MGPAEFVGWGRRIRTPATWSRATRPTTRRSPTNVPTLPHPDNYRPPRRPVDNTLNRQSADRGLERAARAEARHFHRGNLDLLAGAGVASVARRPARHHERPKSGNCDAAAAAQRLDDAPDHGVHGALRGDLRAPRVLGHDRHKLSLGHPILRPPSLRG